MTKRIRPLLALLTLPLIAAAPPADAPKAPACARVSGIDSWKDVDASTVILESAPKHRYKVTFTAPCPDTKRGIMVLIERPPSAGACLSPGDALVFLRRATVPPQSFHYDERCVIKTIEALPEE
jgi:hypothetical protein